MALGNEAEPLTMPATCVARRNGEGKAETESALVYLLPCDSLSQAEAAGYHDSYLSVYCAKEAGKSAKTTMTAMVTAKMVGVMVTVKFNNIPDILTRGLKIKVKIKKQNQCVGIVEFVETRGKPVTTVCELTNGAVGAIQGFTYRDAKLPLQRWKIVANE